MPNKQIDAATYETISNRWVHNTTIIDHLITNQSVEHVTIALVDIDRFFECVGGDLEGRGEQLLDWTASLLDSIEYPAIRLKHGFDEFLLIWPNRTLESAFRAIDAVRARIESTPFIPHDGAAALRITVTVGIASFPQNAQTAQDLLRLAVDAQQAGKAQGRNCVMMPQQQRMVLKSNYYTPGQLARLARLARLTSRTEAELLREALDRLLYLHDQR